MPHLCAPAGVYFLRNTPGGTALINKWYEIRKEKQKQGFHDQDGLYKYLTEQDKEEIHLDKRWGAGLGVVSL